MALAVLGGDSLDTLEAWVKELFGQVPSGRGSMRSFKDTPAPYQVILLHFYHTLAIY